VFGLTRRDLFASGTGLLLVGASLGASSAKAWAFFPLRLSDAQWRRRLSPAAYAVLRRAGTERPGSSPLAAEKRRGSYACAGCGSHLFQSDAKFESETGWPSFYRAGAGAVRTRVDRSLPSMSRTEVVCARCGEHLGHLFDDGPKPTGLRYCMNGVALSFRPA
jgi:peptide-methionine (R)-S-oxide reductase